MESLTGSEKSGSVDSVEKLLNTNGYAYSPVFYVITPSFSQINITVL